MAKQNLKKKYIEEIRKKVSAILSDLVTEQKAVWNDFLEEKLSSDMYEEECERLEKEAYTDIDRLYEKALDRGLTSSDMPELYNIENDRAFEELLREAQENE